MNVVGSTLQRDHGKCPVTGESLTMDDLIPVKTGKIVKPRQVQAASISGMLGMFQNEWDALVLSAFASEQQLHTTRQELSHCLYQMRAAVPHVSNCFPAAIISGRSLKKKSRRKDGCNQFTEEIKRNPSEVRKLQENNLRAALQQASDHGSLAKPKNMDV